MKRIITLALLMLTVSALSFPVEKNSNPVLKFNSSGRFKIVQFTDVHYIYNSYKSDSALILLKKVMKLEKPDLVVFTGDVVIAKEKSKGWSKVAALMNDIKIPWAVALGNHDIEGELTGGQIMQMLGNMPYSLTENGPEDISGNGNYVLKIQSSKSNKTSGLVYIFDSHSNFPNRPRGKWDYIKFDQIEWYRKQSSELTKANGGQPLPALAFFHIPLAEYKEIKNTTIGMHRETVTPSEFNSGLFTAMFESKDVMGVFVGHNHNNNYIGCYNNICLGFGNCSGRDCYGKIGRGARVIELYEGEHKFSTWILSLYDCDREKETWVPTGDNSPKFFVTYPDSFLNIQESGDTYIEYMEQSDKGK
jgi:predicted phosphodiesterase